MANVAVGDRATLNTLFASIKTALNENKVIAEIEPTYRDFRVGDVRHSQADISKAVSLLGYAAKFNILDGIQKAMSWYIQFIRYQK